MKEPDKQVIDDFEHHVNLLISKYGECENSPKMATYGFTKEEFDDYLFDKQAILDMEGSEKSKLIVGGFLIVLPVIVLSAFPEKSLPFGQWSIIVAIALGLLLVLFKHSLFKMLINIKLHKNANQSMDKYIRDLEFFSQTK